MLLALTERSATISPLWQRGERISRPITVTALCDYSDKQVNIRTGDDVTLLDNSDLIKWTIRDISGQEGAVPSVVFRIPPPDPRLTELLSRLLQKYEKLRKLWDKKHRMVRFYMVLNTMKTIQWVFGVFEEFVYYGFCSSLYFGKREGIGYEDVCEEMTWRCSKR